MTDALVRVSGDIRFNLDGSTPTILVLLDFSEAFIAYIIDCSFSNCVNDMAFIPRRRLFHRHQRVGCGDDFSALANKYILVVGVPQGSPIPPTTNLRCFFFVEGIPHNTK
jgi:hypothetical protein